jgi:hypothetical protein
MGLETFTTHNTYHFPTGLATYSFNSLSSGKTSLLFAADQVFVGAIIAVNYIGLGKNNHYGNRGCQTPNSEGENGNSHDWFGRRRTSPLGGDEVQTLVKFVNLPSPHPLPSPLGRGWPQAG